MESDLALCSFAFACGGGFLCRGGSRRRYLAAFFSDIHAGALPKKFAGTAAGLGSGETVRKVGGQAARRNERRAQRSATA
jgi:hypothetical protein